MQRLSRITDLEPNGPGERIGLRVGDYVTHVNGIELLSGDQLTEELGRLSSGRTATINRAGQDITFALPDGRLGMITREEPADLSEARREYAFAAKVAVVTLEAIDGKRIERVLGIVTAEYAVGMNIIKDVLVGGRDLFGGRSQTVQDAFKEATVICTSELRQQALALGANAVLGVRMQHSQMSGTGSTMLLMVMSGTAVILE